MGFGVRWRVEGTLGGGGTFCKITTYWPPLDERVCSSFAEICQKLESFLQNYKIFMVFLNNK